MPDEEVALIYKVMRDNNLRGLDTPHAGAVLLPFVHLNKFYNVIPLTSNEEKIIYLSRQAFKIKASFQGVELNVNIFPLTAVFASTNPSSIRWAVIYDASRRKEMLIKEEFRNRFLEQAYEGLSTLTDFLKLK